MRIVRTGAVLALSARGSLERPVALLTACALLLSGCSTFREIPRSDYAAHPALRNVRVVTRDTLKYEFESARVTADTLTGFHRRDTGGPIDEYDTVRLPLDQVSSLRVRRTDWYRTGLIGGLAVATVVVAGLAARANSGGGGNDNPPPPCRNCTPQK